MIGVVSFPGSSGDLAMMSPCFFQLPLRGAAHTYEVGKWVQSVEGSLRLQNGIWCPQPDTQVQKTVLGLVPVSAGDAGVGSTSLLQPIDSDRDPTSESRRRKRIVVSMLGRPTKW